MKIIKGNLITLALAGEFDVISHGCNCFCTMGAGIAPHMAKAFGVDKYTRENEFYKGDYNKLGTISYGAHILNWGSNLPFAENNNLDDTLWREIKKRTADLTYVEVVNSYTQYGFGRNHDGGSQTPLDYVALELCMQKINHTFKGKRVGLPWIGCGLAGGDKNRVREILERTLTDVELTIVELN